MSLLRAVRKLPARVKVSQHAKEEFRCLFRIRARQHPRQLSAVIEQPVNSGQNNTQGCRGVPVIVRIRSVLRRAICRNLQARYQRDQAGPWVRGTTIGSRQQPGLNQPVILGLDRCVAFAGGLAETIKVGDQETSPPRGRLVRDQCRSRPIPIHAHPELASSPLRAAAPGPSVVERRIKLTRLCNRQGYRLQG